MRDWGPHHEAGRRSAPVALIERCRASWWGIAPQGRTGANLYWNVSVVPLTVICACASVGALPSLAIA